MGIVVLQPPTLGMPQSRHAHRNDLKEHHGMNTLHSSALPKRTQAVDLNVPVVQYASGKIEARKPGEEEFGSHVGFYSEYGIDDVFDEAMHNAGFAHIEISHPREKGEHEIKRHWDLGTKLGMWPICAGPIAGTASDSTLPPYAARTAQAGIKVRWRNNKSSLAVRGYLFRLVRNGYVFPIQVSMRSRMTDCFLDALHDHLAVVEEADQLVQRADLLAAELDEATMAQLQQQDALRAFAFYDVLLPLGVGPQTPFKGKGGTSRVRPVLSAHPQDLTAEYIRRLWRPTAVLEAIQRDWETTVIWAQTQARADATSDT